MFKVNYWHVLAMCGAFTVCTAVAQQEKSCKDLLHRVGNASIGLPFDPFDQEDGSSWRLLPSSGCHAEAALLLDTYIGIHESQLRVVKWHLAQVLANEGARSRLSRKRCSLSMLMKDSRMGGELEHLRTGDSRLPSSSQSGIRRAVRVAKRRYNTP